MTNGDQELRRRAFLSATVASVGGLLADRLPGERPLLDGEPLTQIGDTITSLRYLDGRDGAASVLMPASWLANRLTHALGPMPPDHEERRLLATLAAEADRLAAWVSFETGENDDALHWYNQAIKAAEIAQNPDFAAFAAEGRARVLWLGLGNGEAALRGLDKITLDRLSPRLRAVVHEGRARALAATSGETKENASLRALDQAATAAVDDGPAFVGWLGTPAHVEVGRGLTLVDLGAGHGKDAYRLLKGSLWRLPTSLRRVSGTLHRGLAQAALLMGEPSQAAEHVVQAHEVFTATASRQLIVIREIADELRDQYGDVQAVRELPDRLRTDTRYVLCRTSDDGTKVHLRSCGYARRGGAHAWAAAEGVEPADLPASHLRQGFSLCVRCLPS